ncbi:hypothetical protein ACIRPT_02530 [Streptomyces sp. NPDC101227]|uniref:hypothetical protein n=1 Tax=Streptomyces sp. NPDC101227 TaxID=3366136 RepID=UPI00382A4604
MSPFVRRLFEEALVVAVVAFGSLFIMDEKGFTAAAALAGGQAAARAVYALFVKRVGSEEYPSMTG